MKTHIDSQVGRVFCLTLAEMEEFRNWAKKGWLGDEKQKAYYLAKIGRQLDRYLEEGENENLSYRSGL